MPYEEVTDYLSSIVGSRDWVGFPVIIKATPLTLGEGKARIVDAHEFIMSCEFTMLKAQLEQAAAQEAFQAKMDQE